LNNIYVSMNMMDVDKPIQGNNSITLFAGLSADELTLASSITNTTYLGYYQNALSATLGSPSAGSEHWTPLYNYVFKCNAAIKGLTHSTTLTPNVKQQLLGEAKFMRAFVYFYLVNLFGDVPLALTTDPEINSLLARSPKSEIYQQIVLDLTESEMLLSDKYLASSLLAITTERVRPTKWAAKALLARVYLYTGEYAKSETESTSVINNSTLYGPLPTLNNAFLKNSREAIWQIQPTSINFNTGDAQTFIIPATGPSTGGDEENPVYLSQTLLKSFEPSDQRALNGNWVDTTIYTISSAPLVQDTIAFAYKYKINSSPGVTSANSMAEYFMVLRLGEQYLIRSEARVYLGNIGGAQSDLNTIRNRAGLSNTIAGDMASLLNAILHERQVELFCEWGHRWLDLKRTNNVDHVMLTITPQKANATAWKSFQQLYPIPVLELQKAPNLIQNPDY
jgi:starch-binding outer membrane protein, SusD/RagB family